MKSTRPTPPVSLRIWCAMVLLWICLMLAAATPASQWLQQRAAGLAGPTPAVHHPDGASPPENRGLESLPGVPEADYAK